MKTLIFWRINEKYEVRSFGPDKVQNIKKKIKKKRERRGGKSLQDLMFLY